MSLGPLVVMDVWDYHWCKTWQRRMEDLLPVLNRGLAQWRQAGGVVVYHPGSLEGFYRVNQARERIQRYKIMVPRPIVRVAPIFELDYAPAARCSCGPPFCKPEWVWTRQHPALQVAEGDYMAFHPESLIALCQHYGWSRIYYAGGAANWCMQERPLGFPAMYAIGFDVTILRDLTLVWHGDAYQDPEGYDGRFYDWLAAHYSPARTLKEVLDDHRAGQGLLEPAAL